MTVNYSDEKLYRLFLKWRGSIWKMVYKELIIFLICFYALNFIYRFELSELQQITFEKYVHHIESYRKTYLPTSFLLGFYVSIMVNRWWKQFELLPWPDRVLSSFCFNVSGSDDRSKMLRSTVTRYLNLSSVLAFRDLSTSVRKRFPTLAYLKAAGLITKKEIEEIQIVFTSNEDEFTLYDEVQWVIPIEWIQRIFEQLMQDGIIVGPLAAGLLKELQDFRTQFKKLFQYGCANLPLVYTHVAAIVVYTNFTLAIVGQQFVCSSGHNSSSVHVEHQLDYYVPIITLIELMFYIGWFKVGCELMIPYGEDDNDIDLNFFIDRHWSASTFFSEKIRTFSPCSSANSKDPNCQALKRLPHTLLSAQLHLDSVKLPAKFKFNEQKYNIDLAPQIDSTPPKKSKRSKVRKTHSAEDLRNIRRKTGCQELVTTDLSRLNSADEVETNERSVKGNIQNWFNQQMNNVVYSCSVVNPMHSSPTDEDPTKSHQYQVSKNKNRNSDYLTMSNGMRNGDQPQVVSFTRVNEQ